MPIVVFPPQRDMVSGRGSGWNQSIGVIDVLMTSSPLSVALL
jgi:hypothetical protein